MSLTNFYILCDFNSIETENGHGHNAKPTTGTYVVHIVREKQFTCNCVHTLTTK